MTEWNSIEARFWGLTGYSEAEQLQLQAWHKVREGHPGFILGGSVETVVTQGLRAQKGTVFNPQWKCIATRRGGETTLHSPGQLLIYPVVDLRKMNWGVKDYIGHLLEVSESCFHSFGVPARVQWEPLGLWTAQGKIGFCGVQIKSGISQHGLALNIDNDLSLFQQVISCGLKEACYDKASCYGSKNGRLPEFFEEWGRRFQARLNPRRQKTSQLFLCS